MNALVSPITTARLQLLPQSPAHFRALIESVDAFERAFEHPAAPGLRDFVDSGEISSVWLDRLKVATEPDVWVHGFAVVLRSGGQVIGTAGFKGGPDVDGAVEIAYGIVPSEQSRGYATEAAAALVGFASADPRVGTVRAHTLPQPNASTRVLAKCGFTRVGKVIDPEDGLVWRWERPAAKR